MSCCNNFIGEDEGLEFSSFIETDEDFEYTIKSDCRKQKRSEGMGRKEARKYCKSAKKDGSLTSTSSIPETEVLEVEDIDGGLSPNGSGNKKMIYIGVGVLVLAIGGFIAYKKFRN
jgi:hypothetical protein